VPTVELADNGELLLMGRSSNSSHFQLSANRLISRVHVKARYIAAPTPLEPNRMEIICNGWNGVKLHCQGRTWELFKGDTFTSETEGTDIMLDALDARVMLQWPRRGSSGADALSSLSDSSWDESPRRAAAPASLQSSPLRRTMRIQSPESPTPGHLSSSQRLQALFPETESRDEQSIQIYEDEPELELPAVKADVLDVNVSMRTDATASFSSDLSDLDENDENNPDEENDPLVHSFGPFGADISGRFASISTRSPKPFKSPKAKGSPSGLGITARGQPITKSFITEALSPRRQRKVPCEPLVPCRTETAIKSEPGADANDDVAAAAAAAVVEIDPSITNHVVNQLAFSRLSSTPLSTIMHNLPDKEGLDKESLRAAIEANAAIGIIKRQGKDAAGKALESEYYYVPENDDDEQRRAAVVDGLRKPSLRNCRKQHKVRERRAQGLSFKRPALSSFKVLRLTIW
jgi:hypothetical protein